MNKSTFDNSSRDLESSYNKSEKKFYGLYNSEEEYNIDLITYLYSINNDYEFTINDPKMREIEERILTYNSLKDKELILKSKDDVVVENIPIDTPVEDKVKIENYKQPLHKLENESKFHQFSILSGSGESDLDKVREISDEMMKNWKNKYIIPLDDQLSEHVKHKIYFDLSDLKGYVISDPIKAHFMMKRFCSDIRLLAIRIPTLNANSEDEEKKFDYSFNMFLSIYYITLFNQQCNVKYKDVYKYCGCNYSITPAYHTPTTIGNGNCKHSSVLGYLYLKDPELLRSIIYNELESIRDIIIKYDKTNEHNKNWINEKIKFCEDEIKNLYPSLLFSLILAVLNKGFYNLYNSDDTITYDQLKKEIVFYRTKNEVYDNFYNSIKQLNFKDRFTPIDELEEYAKKLYSVYLNRNETLRYIILDYGEYENFIKLKPITIDIASKLITHNDEFIYDVPFIISGKTSLNGGHVMVLRPIRNGIYQLVDPNDNNEYFLTELNSDTHYNSGKLSFRCGCEKGNKLMDFNFQNESIIMNFDDNIKEELRKGFNFPKYIVDSKGKVINFNIKQIFYDEGTIRNPVGKIDKNYYIRLNSILTTYTTEYIEKRLADSEMIEFRTKCYKKTLNNDLKLFIMYVTGGKKEIHQCDYDSKSKKFEFDPSGKPITENFLNVIMDNSHINILLIPYKYDLKVYLYMNNYKWLNIDIENIQDNRLLYINDINEVELYPSIKNNYDDYAQPSNEYIWKLRKKDEISEAIKIVKNKMNEYNYTNFAKEIYKLFNILLKGSSLNSGLLNKIRYVTSKRMTIILFILVVLIVIVVIVLVVGRVNKHKNNITYK